MAWISAVFDGFALAATASERTRSEERLAPGLVEGAQTRARAFSSPEGRARMAAVAAELRAPAHDEVHRWPLRAQAIVAPDLPPHRRPHGLPRPRPRYRPTAELRSFLRRLQVRDHGAELLGIGRAAIAAVDVPEVLGWIGAEESAAVLQLRRLGTSSRAPSALVVAACRVGLAHGMSGSEIVAFVGRFAQEHAHGHRDGAQVGELEALGCLA